MKHLKLHKVWIKFTPYVIGSVNYFLHNKTVAKNQVKNYLILNINIISCV